MQLPTIPAFTQGESSVLHLAQLAQAAQFAAIADYFPLWRFYKGAGENISANTWTTLLFGSIAIDTDQVWNSGGWATVNTQGYYATEACVPFQNNGSANGDIQVRFLWTAGPNNPHYGSGSTQIYGGSSSSVPSGSGGTTFAICTADHCPVVCYPGDNISVEVGVSSALTTDTLTNNSATLGWFTPSFGGRWVRMGA